ncbi:MAG TPA: RES family NAD+ phosphorylase [Stellaceae bacterium]|nr:RES family NAD+ phosphorylase [Stellaceae bacterium]
MADPLTPPIRRIVWPAATRIIASRHPPIDLYERVSPDPAIRDALIAAEMLTNPRLRDEVGEIGLVAAEDRVSGPGATWVMASFTHLNPQGSRFSNGKWGVYYAAEDRATAIAETIHHFGRYASDAGDGPRYEDMRVLVGRIDASLHDLAAVPTEAGAAVLDPEDYTAGQSLAARLKAADSNGVHYPSVRRPGGRCVGAFRPRVVGLPIQAGHLTYHWDGERVRRYFDYGTDDWVDLA